MSNAIQWQQLLFRLDLINKINIFIAFLVFPLAGNAQKLWTIGEGGGEESTAIIELSQSFIIGGIFQQNLAGSSSQGGSDIWIQKYDTLGQLQWTNTLGSPTNDILVSLEADQQGFFYALGEYADSLKIGLDTILYSLNKAIFVNKYSPDGQLIWAKSLRATGLLSVKDIKTDNQNNSYLTGSFRDTFLLANHQLITTAPEAVFVLKISPLGQIIWAISSQYATAAYGKSLAIDPNQKIYLAGNFENKLVLYNDTLQGDWVTTDIFLAAIDSQGHWLWQKQYGGAYHDELTTLIWHQNRLYLAGEFMGILTIDTHQLQTAFRKFDIFIAQLDTQGHSLWAKQSQVNANCFLEDLAVNDSQIIAIGYFTDTIAWQTANSKSTAAIDAYQLALNSSGNNPHFSTWRGGGNDLAKACILRFNGGTAVVGSFQQDINWENKTAFATGFSDAFLAYQPPISLPNGLFFRVKPKIKITIFPNPTSDFVQIKSDSKIYFWQLYSPNGQLVKQGKSKLLNLKNLTTGIYILKIKTTAGIGVVKVVVRG